MIANQIVWQSAMGAALAIVMWGVSAKFSGKKVHGGSAHARRRQEPKIGDDEVESESDKSDFSGHVCVCPNCQMEFYFEAPVGAQGKLICRHCNTTFELLVDADGQHQYFYEEGKASNQQGNSRKKSTDDRRQERNKSSGYSEGARNRSSTDPKDPTNAAYKTLRLSAGASLQEIKAARARLLKHYHEDKFSHMNLDAEHLDFIKRKCQEINDAYEFLVKK